MSHIVIEFLRKYLPLTEEEEKKIIPLMHYKRLSKHQLLISSGEVCDKIIFITDNDEYNIKNKEKEIIRLEHPKNNINDINWIDQITLQPVRHRTLTALAGFTGFCCNLASLDWQYLIYYRMEP